MDIRKYTFPPHGDDRGQLVAIEEMKDLPFDIKRVYYIYDTLADGSCKIHLDNGHETAEVLLDKPNEGLYIENDMWREMYDFTPDAVLLVLASEYYDEADYIRNYDEFRKFIASKESEN